MKFVQSGLLTKMNRMKRRKGRTSVGKLTMRWENSDRYNGCDCNKESYLVVRLLVESFSIFLDPRDRIESLSCTNLFQCQNTSLYQISINSLIDINQVRMSL